MNNIIVGLPCYNEEGNILKVIDDIKGEINNIKKLCSGNVKILVVDDGSSDNTLNILKEVEGIIIVEHDVNQGLGAAVNTIFKKFLEIGDDSDMLVIMDSDFTHKAKYIKDLVKQRKENLSLNVIICSRYIEGSEVRGLSKTMELLSVGASMYNQSLLHIKGVKDYTCGYRLYDYRVIKGLDTRSKNKNKSRIVETNNFSCMVEVAYKISKMGGNFGEIPFILEYGDREGQSKMRVFQTIISSLLLPFKLRFKRGI